MPVNTPVCVARWDSGTRRDMSNGIRSGNVNLIAGRSRDSELPALRVKKEVKMPDNQDLDKLRVRCPICGFLPYAKQILEQEEPFEIELKEMGFVGSSRLSVEDRLHRQDIGRRTRGAGKGKIEYRPVGKSPLIGEIRDRFKQICQKFLE